MKFIKSTEPVYAEESSKFIGKVIQRTPHFDCKYEREAYDKYEKEITLVDIASALRYIDNTCVGEVTYSGEPSDFMRHRMHVSLCKMLTLLETGELKLNQKEGVNNA